MKNSNNVVFTPHRIFPKQICPKCNQKRFVTFLDKESGEIIKNDPKITGLEGEYTGKCDSARCGYFIHWSPVVYKRISRAKNKIVDLTPLYNSTETSIHIIKYRDYFYKLRNGYLYYYLRGVFKDNIASLEKTFFKYKMGGTVFGKTFYPFFKDENTLIAAKVIEYNRDTGKRQNEYTWTAGQVKKENRVINWLPFGYQLIEPALKSGIDTIVIHEGVKNPLIADIVDNIHGKNRLHIATGSAYYFESLNKVRKDIERFKNIYIIPDKGYIMLGKKKVLVSDYWKNKINIKGAKYLDFLEMCVGLPDGSDYVDYLQLKGII